MMLFLNLWIFLSARVINSFCFSESVECSQLHVPCVVVSRIHEADNFQRADTQRKMQIKLL